MRVTLETERLILRNLVPEDYEAMFKWCGDPVVNEYMFYTLYTNPLDCKAYIESLNPDDPDIIDLGIVLKETGELIGMGGLTWHGEKNAWEIGYNIRRDLWGNGLAPEAMKAIMEHVESLGRLNSVYGTFAKANPKSGRVMEKLGLTYCCDTTYEKMDGSRTFEAVIYRKDYV